MRRLPGGGGEALTGGVQAGLLSSEITTSGLPTPWTEGEGNTVCHVSASGAPDPLLMFQKV